MADKPILCSGPEVRALLDGRKTQARRALKNAPHGSGITTTEVYPYHRPDGNWIWCSTGSGVGLSNPFATPCRVGDRLWVRETFIGASGYDDLPPTKWGNKPIWYCADGEPDREKWWHLSDKARPSTNMPRWASRLTLTVTDVRVQRVQDISEADAAASGVERLHGGYHDDDDVYENYQGGQDFGGYGAARSSFRTLWNSLNAKRGFGWDQNPWVAAYTFTVERKNIDG